MVSNSFRLKPHFLVAMMSHTGPAVCGSPSRADISHEKPPETEDEVELFIARPKKEKGFPIPGVVEKEEEKVKGLGHAGGSDWQCMKYWPHYPLMVLPERGTVGVGAETGAPEAGGRRLRRPAGPALDAHKQAPQRTARRPPVP
ncbi:hypothetical protein ZHAS_00014083 [Anopheles sinensis]|uniref:Uncharacterized protein n=1 Tax=Anopheles sinensis TaxID=74873 RepID=A0A084W7B1_ANOSI|nr:hypothetical protein ZHAS_00014083 [Anopheles sinensis]